MPLHVPEGGPWADLGLFFRVPRQPVAALAHRSPPESMFNSVAIGFAVVNALLVILLFKTVH